MNVEGNDQLTGLRHVRAYGLRTEEWGGIHPARRFQPALAGLKPRRGGAGRRVRGLRSAIWQADDITRSSAPRELPQM